MVLDLSGKQGEIAPMKVNLLHVLVISAALGCTAGTAGAAQGRGMGPGPFAQPARFSKAMLKVFGENTGFSSDLEIQAASQQGKKIPGKLAFDQGKTRFEMDMAKASGMPGLDKMVMISLPDKNNTLTIFPSVKGYVQTDFDKEEPSGQDKTEFTVKMTKEGEESVDGHATIKNKVVVNDGTNAVYEATVWNATDLKNFPVKIEQAGDGDKVTMFFKNVKLQKPAADMFEVPAGYTKYANMLELMQDAMKKQQGAGGAPGINRGRQ